MSHSTSHTFFDEDSDVAAMSFKPRECRICHCPVTQPEELVMSAGKAGHSSCVRHKRYLEDQARKNGALQAIRSYEAKKPSEFGEKIRELENAGEIHANRGVGARVLVQSFITECVEFSKISYVRATMYLGRRAHRAWLMLRLSYTESEADKKWDDDVCNPEIRRKNEDGTLKLALPGHSEETDPYTHLTLPRSCPPQITRGTAPVDK